MSATRGLKARVAVIVLLTAMIASAFEPVPKESAKALGITRGKPFSKGVVFINGKYITPPYVVERWGTGLRINSQPVTGQVIDWNEFLKTQDGVKVTTTEVEPASVADEPASVADESASAAKENEYESLEGLFDDEPVKNKPSQVKRPAARQSAVVSRPKVQTSYHLEGEFVPNDESKALVRRINMARTDLDKWLRAGGFLCFGDDYARVSGDSRTLDALMKVLPELQQQATELTTFCAGARSANLVFLNEMILADLFENRGDYLKLRERRKRLHPDQNWKRELNDISAPLF